MTDMMIKASELKEANRANRAKEWEQNRSNVAKERQAKAELKEKRRSNMTNETMKGISTAWDIGKDMGKAAAISAINDPEWYLEGNKEYTLGTVPDNFDNIKGFVDIVHTNVGTIPVNHPGILTLGAGLTYGEASGKAYDAINKAAKTIYTQIQQATSYAKSYQANDMMMYLLAMDSLFALTSHIKRAIGLVGLHSTVNAYITEPLVAAAGVTYDDLNRNLSDAIKALNSRITLLKDFNIPDIPIYHRHSNLFSAVYSDYDTQKSQFYLFLPCVLYKYVLDDSGTTVIGKLESKTLYTATGRSLTIRELLNIWDELYTAFGNNTDFGKISGDMGKAFTSRYEFAYVPSDYATAPVKNNLMLQQIRNATIFPHPVESVDFSISQPGTGSGYITASYGMTIPSDLWDDVNGDVATFPQENYLNFWYDENLSKENILDMSRLSCFFSNPTSSRSGFRAEICGSDVILWARTTLFYLQDGEQQLGVDAYSGLLNRVNYTEEQSFRKLSHMMQFDNFPLIYKQYGNGTGQWYAFHNFDNYRLFNKQEFKYMNEAALRSLLGGNGNIS